MAVEAAGYQLVGGRLLPGLNSPIAQFMYENKKGQPLTLYLRTFTGEGRQTASDTFMKATSACSIRSTTAWAMRWRARRVMEELLRLPNLVYRQFNP